ISGSTTRPAAFANSLLVTEIKKSCRTFAGSISRPMQHVAFAWSGHKRWLAVRATAIFDSRGSNRSRTRHRSFLGHKLALRRQCRVCRSPERHQAVAIVEYVYIDHAHALAAAPHTTHDGKRGLDSWLEVVDAKIYGRQRASEHHRQAV